MSTNTIFSNPVIFRFLNYYQDIAENIKMMKYPGIILSITGVLLLLVAMIGHWGTVGKYESKPPRSCMS